MYNCTCIFTCDSRMLHKS